jgi:two-component system response regulator FixJ
LAGKNSKDGGQVVVVLDDDTAVRESLAALLESDGHRALAYASGREFLDAYDGRMTACLVTDVHMPGANGLEVLASLKARDAGLPIIVITGHADVPMAVKAMRAGAFDFVEKPINGEAFLGAVRAAIVTRARDGHKSDEVATVRVRFADLTPREQDVLRALIIGHPNKVIANKLGISPRTVEIHRARVMEKMQAQSLSHLVRMAIAADLGAERPDAGA